MERRSLKEVLFSAYKLFLNDIKSAKWAVALVIAYFVLLKRALHSMCLMVLVTGLPCPGCGLTRAGVALLHLDFAGAWRLHPFIYPIVALIIVFAVRRYFLQSTDMKILNWCLIAVLAGMIFFYIWRMWRYFPGEPPMSWYRDNLMHKAYSFIAIIGLS